MTNKNSMGLQAGQIRLDYLSIDWPLTPLGENKNPYVQGWQNKPYTPQEIEAELGKGLCKAVGLISGPAYNKAHGYVWVDVDGPSVYPLVEKLSGQSFSEALPPTLTICSGKEGRERKLYRLPKEGWSVFVRNKYVWHSDQNKEKLEVLWSKHQGVLMGSHPETDGYFTAPGEGYEWVDRLPELPLWILADITEKNEKQGMPNKDVGRVVGPGFAFNTCIPLERDMQLAREAMWAMPPEATDDYDIWIIVGQSLHALDESLLDEWDEWSKQSSKYREGECLKRWRSFSKGGGRSMGSLIHMAKQNGWQPSKDHLVMNVDDDMLEQLSEQLKQIEEELEMPVHTPEQATSVKGSFVRGSRGNSKREGGSDEGEQKKGGGKQNHSADVITGVLLQQYKGNLRYSRMHNQFFVYGGKHPGLWSPLGESDMKGKIRNELEDIKSVFLPKGYSIHLINDLFAQLKITLMFEDWHEGSDYLLFSNGILDVQERKLLPFNREMYMTQRFPYEYNPSAECEEIIKWLKQTQDGDWGRVQVLRAWLRAVLLGCSDIQKFVEIVGPGKSGKSTYSNLAHALVGDENATISSLEHLEKNRFETSNLYKKKLLLFNDVERYGGSVSVLKALTGGDLIRNEQKFQADAQKPFKFGGLVMITANEPIQTTDPTSGLARRRLTIPFNNPFKGTASQQHVLIDMDEKGNAYGRFAPLLPGLVNWVLDLSQDEMKELLMETARKVPFYVGYQAEQVLKSNQLLDWMHHSVIFEFNVASAVGFAKPTPQGSSGVYVNHDKWLYASYCEFCKYSNTNILGRSRFESLLIDACVHQLGLNVYRLKNSRGMRIVNVMVRSNDPRLKEYPSIVELGLNKDCYRDFYGTKSQIDYVRGSARMEDNIVLNE
jgi:P4 family phage/plasmid primase-like protien